MSATAQEAPSAGARILPRAGLIVLAALLVASVAALAGARFGLMLAIGLGIGMTLEGLRFGFAGPWRAMILRREPAGVLAQLLSIGLVAVVALPLLANSGGELVGAEAPIGFAMIGGAFIFGAAMQVVLGCGSGTLVNAGSGNPVGLVALPFFALGSFLGAYHLIWWTELGALPIMTLSGISGLGITLTGLLAVAAILLWRAAPGTRTIPRRLFVAALLLAAFAIGNLLVAGQPWGVVYGLGLWVAKGAAGMGLDLAGSAFWSAPGNAARIEASVLTDYTSLTDFGLIAGAFIVASWRAGGLSAPLPKLPARAWAATVIAGLLLGYSSRLAFGCNVGAFFSGISTGSLHGWVWFAAAFYGSYYGIKLRPVLGLEARR
ncbi:YeeE/YedE thiosulfate transporter family protein [Roseovarius nanhaiticus]|uniref:YeeE/YedE thiosulfate transporter family protein n=1 Tax=Roseovarius nanhaiticus TaxID=573024 RepID=UPI002493392D|nr:YeeE/YedE thiosulfate transporter family protein [Roseovarius nanhaiticus]